MSNELTNIETGEIIPVEPAAPPSAYTGIAMRAVSQTQRETLTATIPEEDLDILPTGEVYASQIRYRRILNEAFGPMGWALQPVSPLILKDSIMYREYALFCEGRFVAQAIGEQEYIPNNPRMSYATAAEAAKSNALVRCCKDLGIASECWDRRFTEEFKAKYCERYFDKRKNKYFWRRKGSVAVDDEGRAAPQHTKPQPEKRQGPDDLTTPQQRIALRNAAASALGGQEQGDTWLKNRMKDEHYDIEDSKKMTHGQYQRLMQELTEFASQAAPAVEDDAELQASFDAAHPVEE